MHGRGFERRRGLRYCAQAMSLRPIAPALAGLLLVAGVASAGRSDGIDPSILAPGLVQANEALSRLEQLTDEAEAIGVALFRVHNAFGQKRALAKELHDRKDEKPPEAKDAKDAKDAPKPAEEEDTGKVDCKTPWLLDLGARSRELGRGFRDAVQSARVQAHRIEGIIVEPTVQPLLDPETSHRVTSLLARVDDLVRSYPEASSWQEKYVEPVLAACEPALVPAAGFPNPAPLPAQKDSSPLPKRKSALIAVIAFGGGFLCPGAVPAAGVMLVSGAICYSDSESCDCEPSAVSPATVLGPETKAGSAN